jgi:hypothetical protein
MTAHLDVPVGVLPDGSSYYAPLGAMLTDGVRVCCHLCGRWFRSVASHLRAHGWTKSDYIAAFGLETGNPLSGAETSRRRSAALSGRAVNEIAIQRAQSAARERARSGALAEHAARAATGRRQPLERRAKSIASLAAVDSDARAAGTRQRRDEDLNRIAAAAAARLGFASFESYVLARLSRGGSLAAISRECGLHKDWVSRHLDKVAPNAPALPSRSHPADVRLTSVAHAAGFPTVDAYLRVRHLAQQRTVAAIALEAGLSRVSVRDALLRHGIAPVPHATKRHSATRRDRAAAQRLGFTGLAEYIEVRRAAGFSWSSMAAETGIPETSLRRRGDRSS